MSVVTEDMEKRIRQFIDVRDRIKAIEDEQKKLLKPLKEIQEILAGKIQAFMTANSVENLRTAAGTCYTTTRYTASLADPELFMNFVKTHNCFELMDRRANSAAVRDFVEKTKTLPPGCNLSSIETVGVRRAGSTPTAE